jgi:hypothetical protein
MPEMQRVCCPRLCWELYYFPCAHSTFLRASPCPPLRCPLGLIPAPPPLPRSAIVLGQYLTSARSPLRGRAWPSGRARPVALELGAGTGAVSLCLLAGGAAEGVVLTDIPDMLPHLSRNVAHNARALNPARALVAPLRWADATDGGPAGGGGGMGLFPETLREGRGGSHSALRAAGSPEASG